MGALFVYSFKVKKATCQSYYHGVGAKEKAKEKRAADLQATAAATERYADQRESLTTNNLHASLEQQSGKRHFCYQGNFLDHSFLIFPSNKFDSNNDASNECDNETIFQNLLEFT